MICAGAAAASILQGTSDIRNQGSPAPPGGRGSVSGGDSIEEHRSSEAGLGGVLLSCALAVLAATVAPAQEAPPRPFLRKVIQLDDAQLAALKKCKPGSCDVKLGTKGLEMVSKIDWKAPDAEKQAVALFNQGIVGYVTAYQQGGTDAMGNVLDKKQEKSRAEEYRILLARSHYLVDYVKEFNDYLAAWPRGTLAGAEDVLYWTKDEFGLEPGGVLPTTRPSTRVPVGP